MMEGLSSIITNNMELIILGIILVYMLTWISKTFGSPKDKKKKRDIKTMKDRVHGMLAKNASAVGYKKLSTVYLTGNKDIPKHKVGTTVGGVLNFQEYSIIPVKTRWWNPLETARMMMVEGEALTDLHEGDILIQGSSLHPVTERFTWVVPNQEMVGKYGDEAIQEKREAFAKKMFNELGVWDLNDDVWANTKAAIRGSRASARREQVSAQTPEKRSERQIEKEAQEEQKRIHREEEKNRFDRRKV